MTALVPAGLRALTGRDASFDVWVDALPAQVAALAADWTLAVDGPAMHGRCALVVPVRTEAGERAALKMTWPHRHAQHEHLALQHWHGDGAVRLLRADPTRWAMLLERLSSTDLDAVDDTAACEVVGGLLARLHRPALPQLAPLSGEVARWVDELAGLDLGLPRRWSARAVSLGRELSLDPLTDGTLLHTDLHYQNVLAADREPWLAIDPKPLSGDPAFEVAPLLWNRWPEVAGDVRRGLRRRFDAVVGAAGLDPDRARAWVVVREVLNAGWVLRDAARAGRAPTPDERAAVTRAIAVVKAVSG